MKHIFMWVEWKSSFFLGYDLRKCECEAADGAILDLFVSTAKKQETNKNEEYVRKKTSFRS